MIKFKVQDRRSIAYCVMLAGVEIYEYSAEDVNCNAVM